MKKKNLVLLTSSLLIAGFAFGCAPKTPEDRIIKVADTLYDKMTSNKDCAKLAKDLESYCKDSNADLTAAAKELLPAGYNKESEAIKKVTKTMEKLDGLDKDAKAVCANDEAVLKAMTLCITALMPVIEATAKPAAEPEVEADVEAPVEADADADVEAEDEAEGEAEAEADAE